MLSKQLIIRFTFTGKYYNKLSRDMSVKCKCLRSVFDKSITERQPICISEKVVNNLNLYRSFHQLIPIELWLKLRRMDS